MRRLFLCLCLLVALLCHVDSMCAAKICTRHVHFNNAGASPSPPQVLDATIEHMRLESEVGAYRAAELASDKVDRVYTSVAQLIGAGYSNIDGSGYNPRDEIALTESATVSWTRVFYSMLETKERELISRYHQKEMIILVSEAEYAANCVAAVKFARDHTQLSGIKWRVVGIPSSVITKGTTRISTGMVDLDSLQSILDGKVDDINPASIAMICITHIPTNCHIVNPVTEIGNMIHDFNTKDQINGALPNIFYLVDACQSVGQLVINVKEMKCHAAAATGRKYVRGPRGTGFLYVQKDIANALQPSHIDHAAAPVVRVMTQQPNQGVCVGLEEENEYGLLHSYQPGAARFEFWEANIAARLGLGAAIDVSLAIGMDKIENLCSTYGEMLRKRIAKIDRVNVYHYNDHDQHKCGIVTFWCNGIEASTIKEMLQNGCQGDGCCFHLSIVPATSTPLDSSRTGLGMKQLLRASLSYFNTADEIELFCKALQSILHSAA
eukprot:scaffold4640_cov112-Skeletonema_marinoi.AAC.3